MSLAPCIVAGVMGWGIVQLITPRLLKIGRHLRLNRQIDLHHHDDEAVPRLGGLALIVAFVVLQCLLLLYVPRQGELFSKIAIITLASLAMFTLGFWDDLAPLGARKKLLGQILIAGIVSWSGIGIECLKLPAAGSFLGSGAWEMAVSILWIVSFTNLINLIDGADGLAGGISLILMGFITCASFNDTLLVGLTAGMCGALLAFLRYNIPPARIYLGDSGAYLLGFQLGLFSILLSRVQGAKGLAAPLFGLVLPIADTGLAVVRRGLIGLPLFRPDRNHLHHQLLAMGMSPSRVMISFYCLTLVFLLTGIVGLFCWSGRFMPVCLALVLLVLSACAWKIRLCRTWGALRAKVSESLALRREIGYALCLRNWLKYERERCSSVEDFYRDFSLAAHRLGFSAVRLGLTDGNRLWSDAKVYGARLSACHSFQGGALGVLELEAPKCRLRSRGTACTQNPSPECAGRCRHWNNPRRFKILGELLAETWIDAARSWGLKQAKLRFDAKLSGTGQTRTQIPIEDRRKRTHKLGSELVKPKTFRIMSWTPRRFFGRALGLAVGALALTSLQILSSDVSSLESVEQSLAAVPRIELPGKAAGLVQAAIESERPSAITNVVRITYKVSPAIIPSVVSALSRAVPAMAEIAAATAAQQEPSRAAVFAKIAARAAPDRAGHIVRAVCRVVPDAYQSILRSVAQIVPGATNELLETLPPLFPKLRDPPDRIRHEPNRRPPLSTILEAAVAQASKPELSSRPAAPVRGGPQIRGPSIGPPFVPLSGTVSNITTSTSGTVSTGGRSYARP